jgi:hypothetical protein
MKGTVGHHVKIQKITPTVGNTEHGDIEIKDYVDFP